MHSMAQNVYICFKKYQLDAIHKYCIYMVDKKILYIYVFNGRSRIVFSRINIKRTINLKYEKIVNMALYA